MSLYWNIPHDGQCCGCRPNPCDPCDSCPTGETVDVVVSGIVACCSTTNRRITGLGAVNGVHTLAQQSPGEYSLDLPAAVSIALFGGADCSNETSTIGPYGVTVALSCGADRVALDIRLTGSSTRLFYAEIVPPAPGELFVFVGAEGCSAFTPYTYGGTATIDPAE